MKKAFEFISALKVNNNREWFDAHRGEYQVARKEFEEFAAALLEELRKFDHSLEGVALRDCLYRINRDTRFSNNKEPYKTHLGAYFAPHGKNSGYGGYYFHIEASDSNFVGGHILAAGNHFYEPKPLESIRTEIFDNPKGFIQTLEAATGFELSQDNKLKRVPRGFPADFEYGEYLKPKDYCLVKKMDDATILSSNLLEQIVAQFRTCHPFIQLINRAVEYAKENM